MVGVLRNTASSINSVQTTQLYLGQIADGYAYFGATGNKFNSNSSSAYGATFTTGDVIGIALDLDAGTLAFYKNGTSQGTAYTGLTGEFLFAFTEGGSVTVHANFGQRPFAYTPPTGFKALNTHNMPDATIKKGNQYFDATTYTGNATGQSVVNAGGFQPDLVWIKKRSSPVAYNLLYDAVRGAGKWLSSNATDAEGTIASSLTAFNSNGFSVGADPSGPNNGWNASGAATVGWQWKKGAAQGFDIVPFSFAAGGTQNIAHSLGVAPKMMIVKSRSNGTQGWVVYHASTGNTGYMTLNLTSAFISNSTTWNNTSPTSSVFTLGSGFTSGAFGADGIAYLFAEVAGFSKFGSYTANGSADGPFVYCGFRPRFVMIKWTNVESWYIFDTERGTYNVIGPYIVPNTSAAEGTYTAVDILSNGFKLRDTNNFVNSSGTYIYAAFAENPFKNSLAR